MDAEVAAIEYFLPAKILSTSELAKEFPEWPAEQIARKTGIRERRIASTDEFAIDLAYEAASKLFRSGACKPGEIDMLIFCTQTPEYLLPAGACVLQERLGLPTSIGAFDFSLGCSGYVYGLGMAGGFILSGQAKSILLLTADTITKLLAPKDKSTRTILGDGAAATLIRKRSGAEFGPFLYGTDGSGAPRLFARCNDMRRQPNPDCADALFMDGPELFSFAIRCVPDVVYSLLARAELDIEAIDLFVFHQANLHILEHLRTKLRIPQNRFIVALEHCGNTTSSSIPIALKEAVTTGKLVAGALVLLVGFGVGFSWGASIVRWSPDFVNSDSNANPPSKD